jgi:hypothetical protein
MVRPAKSLVVPGLAAAQQTKLSESAKAKPSIDALFRIFASAVGNLGHFNLRWSAYPSTESIASAQRASTVVLVRRQETIGVCAIRRNAMNDGDRRGNYVVRRRNAGCATAAPPS